jgi:hypothetical protein
MSALSAPLLQQLSEAADAPAGSAPQRALVALFREFTPQLVTRVRELSRAALRAKMRELSRQHLGEVWAQELEFALWRAVLEGPELVPSEDIADLRELAEECQSWFVSDDPEAFVSLDEWREIYQTWQASPLSPEDEIERLKRRVAELEGDAAKVDAPVFDGFAGAEQEDEET